MFYKMNVYFDLFPFYYFLIYSIIKKNYLNHIGIKNRIIIAFNFNVMYHVFLDSVQTN